MDIVKGDVIEIWLEPNGKGWKSVHGGDSVNHLFKMEDRVEHIPEPFNHKIERIYWENIEKVVPVFVGIIFFIVPVVAYFVIRQFKRYRESFY